MDSTTDRSKCVPLPWLQKRLVREAIYNGDDLSLHAIVRYPPARKGSRDAYRAASDAAREAEESCRKSRRPVADYDGALNFASLFCYDFVYAHGSGAFEWLSWFVPDVVYRRLDVKFDTEFGRGRGSWKGGTYSLSAAFKDGETFEDAWARLYRETRGETSDDRSVRLADRAAAVPAHEDAP